PGRNQPAQQGGQQGGHDREGENAKVERGLLHRSQGNRPSRQVVKQLAGPTSQEKSSGATRAREQQALDAEKLNQAPTARTQRQPDGELAAPPDAARQQESGHVGADDEQDERHHSLQKKKYGATLHRQVVTQAQDGHRPTLIHGVLSTQAVGDQIHFRARRLQVHSGSQSPVTNKAVRADRVRLLPIKGHGQVTVWLEGVVTEARRQ